MAEELSWTLDERELHEAQALIDAHVPETLTLKKLYGRSWDSIHNPTAFGVRFKTTVESGRLHNIECVGKNGANAQLYAVNEP